MKRMTGIMVAAVCLLAMTTNISHVATAEVWATCSSPTSGEVKHTGGTATMSVTVNGTGMKVDIKNGTNGQAFWVTWDMHVEIDGVISTTERDVSSGQLIHCDSVGYWEHKANGTGNVNGTFSSISTGSRKATAFTDIGGTMTVPSKADDKTFSVVNP